MAGASLALAGGAALAVSAPAQAAGSAAVPSCVRALVGDSATHVTVAVRNDCDFPVRVRVNFVPGPAGPCTTVPPRWTHTESRAKPVAFGQLTAC
ncbi:hypothetical protein GCM10010452_68420 [Crossiella cryophila]